MDMLKKFNSMFLLQQGQSPHNGLIEGVTAKYKKLHDDIYTERQKYVLEILGYSGYLKVKYNLETIQHLNQSTFLVDVINLYELSLTDEFNYAQRGAVINNSLISDKEIVLQSGDYAQYIRMKSKFDITLYDIFCLLLSQHKKLSLYRKTYASWISYEDGTTEYLQDAIERIIASLLVVDKDLNIEVVNKENLQLLFFLLLEQQYAQQQKVMPPEFNLLSFSMVNNIRIESIQVLNTRIPFIDSTLVSFEAEKNPFLIENIAKFEREVINYNNIREEVTDVPQKISKIENCAELESQIVACQAAVITMSESEIVDKACSLKHGVIKRKWFYKLNYGPRLEKKFLTKKYSYYYIGNDYYYFNRNEDYGIAFKTLAKMLLYLNAISELYYRYESQIVYMTNNENDFKARLKDACSVVCIKMGIQQSDYDFSALCRINLLLWYDYKLFPHEEEFSDISFNLSRKGFKKDDFF